jgi:hypothetical protein
MSTESTEGIGECKFLNVQHEMSSREHHLILLKPDDKVYAHCYLSHSLHKKHVWKFEVHSFCTHTSHYLPRKQMILQTFMTRKGLICSMNAYKPGNLGSMHSRTRLTFTWEPNQWSIQSILVAFLVAVKLTIHICLEPRPKPSYALMMYHFGIVVTLSTSVKVCSVLEYSVSKCILYNSATSIHMDKNFWLRMSKVYILHSRDLRTTFCSVFH